MNRNQKLVWAAAFALEHSKQYSKWLQTGTYPDFVAITEMASNAVDQITEALPAARKNWSENSDVVSRLKEMAHGKNTS